MTPSFSIPPTFIKVVASLLEADVARSRAILLHPLIVLPALSSIRPHAARGLLVHAVGILDVQRNHRRRHRQFVETHVRGPLKESIKAL